ncbi:MAG: aminoacyl-histidine dipeptidase [Eubacterium sp.]|nr:aminoacyl-histidine dipeptidase [Eubacterium sp.]
MGVLSNIKPEKVFYYFEELTKIPRGSYNEKAVSDYITGFAKDRGLEVYQDDLYNVVIIKEAASGREEDPAIILQGHIDMVNEKTPDSTHDFEKDPLDIYIDGDYIRAKGTTLGADDGIAVAYMLAILDDESIRAPRLEMVFTVSEEVGMEGAHGVDLSKLRGKQLINIDSEDEGILLAGCAGGMRAEVRLPLEYEGIDKIGLYRLKEATDVNLSRNINETKNVNETGETSKTENEKKSSGDVKCGIIKISGLLGGHSGQEIDKQRINADHMLARVLLSLINSGFDIRPVSMQGGGKDNAIPFEAYAEVVFKAADESEIKKKLAEINSEIKNEYRNTDGGATLSLDVMNYEHNNEKKSDNAEHDSAGKKRDESDCYENVCCENDRYVMTPSSVRKALGLILALPNGIVKMSGDIEGLVETSLNLGVMKTVKSVIESADTVAEDTDIDTGAFAHKTGESRTLILTYALRSSVGSAKKALAERFRLIAESFGAKVGFHGEYPAWEYKEKSELRDKVINVFEEMYGRKPEVSVIHAGVECGLLAEKIPGLDAISYGPDMYDIHTANEHLSISSAGRMYDYLIRIIES